MPKPNKTNMKSILLKNISKNLILNQSQKKIIDFADNDLNQLLIFKKLFLTLKTKNNICLFPKNKEKNLNNLHIIGKILYNKSW